MYRTFDWLDLKVLEAILIQFSHLIGFHCLGNPGFIKHTVTKCSLVGSDSGCYMFDELNTVSIMCTILYQSGKCEPVYSHS